MCEDNNRTALITVFGNAPDGYSQRIASDCACRVSVSDDQLHTPSQLHIFVRNFRCSRKCEWWLRVYVDGCVREEICCETTWDSVPNFLFRVDEFTPQTELYVSHENEMSDHNGSLLDVQILACKYTDCIHCSLLVSLSPYTNCLHSFFVLAISWYLTF